MRGDDRHPVAGEWIEETRMHFFGHKTKCVPEGDQLSYTALVVTLISLFPEFRFCTPHSMSCVFVCSVASLCFLTLIARKRGEKRCGCKKTERRQGERAPVKMMMTWVWMSMPDPLSFAHFIPSHPPALFIWFPRFTHSYTCVCVSWCCSHTCSTPPPLSTWCSCSEPAVRLVDAIFFPMLLQLLYLLSSPVDLLLPFASSGAFLFPHLATQHYSISLFSSFSVWIILSEFFRFAFLTLM